MSGTTEPTPDDLNDVSSAMMAMLRAGLSGDYRGAELLAQTVDNSDMLACALGLATSLGVALYGSEEAFGRALTSWTPGSVLPPADAV